MVSWKGVVEILCLGILSGEEEVEFIFCVGDVGFYCVKWLVEDVGCFIVGEVLLVVDVENGLFVR